MHHQKYHSALQSAAQWYRQGNAAGARFGAGTGNCPGHTGKAENDRFQAPYVGRKRKPGTGCVTEINDHLFEGRYSPKWPDDKKHSRNVNAIKLSKFPK